MNDETFLSPSISKVLVETYRTPRKATSAEERYKATVQREREVFQLIAEATRRARSRICCVSASATIKSHRSKIMEKLDLDRPVEAVHLAIQLGLVDPELK